MVQAVRIRQGVQRSLFKHAGSFAFRRGGIAVNASEFGCDDPGSNPECGRSKGWLLRSSSSSCSMLDARCSKLAARSSQPESRAPFAHLDGQQCAHVTSTLRSSHRLSRPPVRQNVGQAFVPRRIQATPQHNSLAAQRARAAQERGGVTVARRRREARPAGGRLGASRSRPDHQRGRQPFPPTRSLSLSLSLGGFVSPPYPPRGNSEMINQ